MPTIRTRILILITGLWALAFMTAPGTFAQTPSPSEEMSSPQTGIVNAESVNIRQGPGLNTKVVGRVMNKGTTIKVLGREGDWIKIDVEGSQGWIYSKYIVVKEEITVPEGKEIPPADTPKETPKALAPPGDAEEPVQTPPAEKVAQPEPDQAASKKIETAADVPAAETKKSDRTDKATAAAPQVPSGGYQQTLKRAMDLVFIFLESIESRQDLTLEQKQKKAIDFIRHLRWGPDNKNYFWINDVEGKMILEPLFPHQEGKDHLTYKDINNKRIFVEFIDKSIAEGEHFVGHQGLGYDQNKSNPRISLVRLFKAWNWVVGTGLEVELIEAYEEPDGLLFNIPLPPISDELPASGT